MHYQSSFQSLRQAIYRNVQRKMIQEVIACFNGA